MTDYPDDITLSKNVIEMVTVANEYCFFMDTIEGKTKLSIIEFVHRVIPLMYVKGTLLPEIEPGYPEANERFVTQEQWENIFTLLRKKFGSDDEFWIIDPQHINETEPLKASLSENMADIYQDMKDIIMLFQKNTVAARENAIADCRTLFAERWGYKIGNILSQLHHLLYNNENEIFEEETDWLL